eukprot:34138-Rhodomonas_salina.1
MDAILTANASSRSVRRRIVRVSAPDTGTVRRIVLSACVGRYSDGVFCTNGAYGGTIAAYGGAKAAYGVSGPDMGRAGPL